MGCHYIRYPCGAVPILWAVATSFKAQRDALQPTIIPFVEFQPILDNWRAELGPTGQENFRALGNSAIIAVGATTVAMVIGTLAGYGLGRFVTVLAIETWYPGSCHSVFFHLWRQSSRSFCCCSG
jgi:multiple sugar transport system permease protein